MFNLYQYQFDDPQNYNSLRLVKQKNYVIATEICLSDIENLLTTVPLVTENTHLMSGRQIIILMQDDTLGLSTKGMTKMGTFFSSCLPVDII